ncbi:MAG: KpsF/GutQ family sugar-phosphate isomerase [bacterium]
MDIVGEIKRVIKQENDTISRLLHTVGSEYKKAVEMIYRCKGKIILTGIGKSGIIAQKITATMVSTGTPAVYVHPTEGMHGDLGIVQKNDVIIALGKSGESSELLGVLLTIKKIGVKIIAITANKESTLAKKSTIVLWTKVEREACPFNLAPTNSTTAALVIGDALSLALMKMRRFRKRDFALYHPGGLLGKRLNLTVGDVMRKDEQNPVVKVNDTVKHMLAVITEKMAGAVSVADKKGKLKGLVTDYDIRKIIESGKNIFKMKIKDIMNPNPSRINARTKAATALEMMEKRERPISLMPVVDNKEKVIGMIHVHDILSKGL